MEIVCSIYLTSDNSLINNGKLNCAVDYWFCEKKRYGLTGKKSRYYHETLELNLKDKIEIDREILEDRGSDTNLFQVPLVF